MRFLIQSIPQIRSRFLVPAVFFATAIVVWPFFIKFQVFEQIFEFSRAHEHWELDEIILLVFNLTVALLFSLIFQSRRLKRMASDRDKLRYRAETTARHDPLTGLFNRRAFSEMIQTLASAHLKSENRVLAILDLDDFKPVNALHGHITGDSVLVEVAHRLRSEAGMGGIVARLSGDEFAVLFDADVDPVTAERASQRLVHAIAQPYDALAGKMLIGASVGLVPLRNGDNIAETMRRAGVAVSLAKMEGRGRFAWYDAGLDSRSLDRAKITADLRDAISNGDVQPYFQPIVDIERNEVTGVEVLARWTHATRGNIPPAVFIEIAEDSGQIGRLGLVLMREACVQARRWISDVTVSINVSGTQFKDPDLVLSLRRVLDETGFDPQLLIVELTESAVIDDFDDACEKLTQLKALGVSIALDDFGTGYASLACLQKLPFDLLKIDRSFVTEIANLPQNQKIVSGIVSLAQGLSLEVTAEGVETLEDLAVVRFLECDRAQGFLFDQAVPAETVGTLLETKWAELPCVEMAEQLRA